MTQEPIGVVLLNLGGPDTLDDVEPFLRNLFSDRRIIRLSPFPFLQGFIAGRIAARRAPKSREAYRSIGGGSPLAAITLEQAQALEQALAGDGPFLVDMAMRYWKPRADEVLQRFSARGVSRVVALTLYPHYSIATTGSSLEDLREAATRSRASFSIVEVRQWPVQPDYVRCLAETIREGMGEFPGEEVRLVYSAHSLPVKFIEEGDPYLEQIRQTIAAVEAETGLAGQLCFQSRSGPVQWLEPSTPDTLRGLAAAGCRNVLMVPISFVSDHVETLYEIDIEYAELAAFLGMRLVRTPSLNTRPGFIKALAALVREACGSQGWLPAAGP